MRLLGGVVKVIRSSVTAKRRWTPAEVRELLERGDLPAAKNAAEHLSPRVANPDAERACLIGEIAFHAHQDLEAQQAFAEALKEVPSMPAAHHGLSLLLVERKDFETAVRHAFFAHAAEPNNPRFLAQLGLCHLRLGNFQQAETPLRRATLLAPRDSYAWNNLGIVLRVRGDFAESRDCFERAVMLRPDDRAARDNLATLDTEGRHTDATKDGQLDPLVPPTADNALGPIRDQERSGLLLEAIDLCETLVVERPDDSGPALELHRLYVRAGDPQSGIDAMQAFLSKHPEATDVAGALGLAMLDMHQLAQAETLLQQAVQADPGSLPHVMALGQSLAGQERFADAAEWLDHAIGLAPDNARARALRAANLVNQCRYEEGLQACRDLEAEGMHIPALGLVLAYLGRFEEAMASLDAHVARHPNDASLRFHRGTVRLLQLDFGGWDDYAYRGFTMSQNFRVLPFPLWKGEPLKGRKIVVLAEQGLGDQVMFSSCLPDLLALEPAEVVVEVIRKIAPTITRSFPACRVIATTQSRALEWVADCPSMDYYIPLGDLPKFFRTALDRFPAHAGYLRPDPERTRYWRRRLEEAGPGPYIGMSWKGGTEGTRTSLRSMDALSFKPLADARPGTWVCLQYGAVQDSVDAARKGGLPLAYWPEAISDLDEFAAIVSALDLVVTVCNTTVHYAGAVGTPVWVLAPRVPEWRYGLSNVTMPWYPSSRVFRQTVLGDWTSTIDAVCHELSAVGQE